MKQPEYVTNGKAVCYLRVSTDTQKRTGLGIGVQRQACKMQLKILGLTVKECRFDDSTESEDGFFVDAAQSAFRKMFADRPASKALMKELERGDTLIISRLDRGFRSVADFLRTSRVLTDMGVRLVICYPRIDLGTASGRVCARHIANMAEWESDRKSERIRAALAQKRLRKANSETKAEFEETVENLESDWRPETDDVALLAPEPKLVRPGRIFFYVRCSHRDSTESGLGLLAQIELMKQFAEGLMVQNPLLIVQEAFTDTSISAMAIPLKKRSAGAKLDYEIEAGDHVIFASLDRGFRSIGDLFVTIPKWIELGVEVHFVSEGITMSDPSGRMMAAAIVLFAEYEAIIISERNKDTRTQLESKGRYCGGYDVPTLWKLWIANGKKKLTVDRRELTSYRLILSLMRNGLTEAAALIRCEDLYSLHEFRPALPPFGAEAGSELERAQPYFVKRNRKGDALPIWHRYQLRFARKNYDKALAAWYLQCQRKISQVKEIDTKRRDAFRRQSELDAARDRPVPDWALALKKCSELITRSILKRRTGI